MSKAKYLTQGFSLNYGVVFAVIMGAWSARAREVFGIASAGVRLPEFRHVHSFYVDTNQAEYLVSTWGIIQAEGFKLYKRPLAILTRSQLTLDKHGDSEMVCCQVYYMYDSMLLFDD